MIHRQGLELEAAGAVLPVDLLPDGGVAHPPADILVDGVIGEAQVVLVGEAVRPSEGAFTRNFSGRPSTRPRAMTSSVVYMPSGEKAPAESP